MPFYVKITIDDIVIRAELFDSECAKSIIKNLPIRSVPHRWGDEYYFEIPVERPLDETATTKVNVGDIGYWPDGRALAIFFGPTPMSTGSDPVPASAVNLVGKVSGDATVLGAVKRANSVTLEQWEE